MIPCQRHAFDIPEDVAYLNCAYMGPLPRVAVEAGLAGMRRKGRPWEIAPADFFDEAEEARRLFAGLVGADSEGVALIPSASYGLAVAALNLSLAQGDRIVTLREQFPSNVNVWRARAAETGAEIVEVATAPGRDPTADVLAAVDDRCALAALPNLLWTTGARLDLDAISARCRAVGAALALDLTQSAGAMRTDLAAVDPDFAVAACYKWLLGPYSTAFLYVAPRWRGGRPLEQTWLGRAGSEDFTRLTERSDAYQPGARRFDMGERSNFATLPALIAALRLIASWGVPAVEAGLAAATDRLAARAAALGLTPPPPGWRAPHYLALALPAASPPDLTARLAARGVHVSRRGASLRVTPHLWVSQSDEDRFAAALAAAL